MHSWLIFTGIVVAILTLLVLLATGFPSASSTILLIGTPIVVVGAGLGAKIVQRRNRTMRSENL